MPILYHGTSSRCLSAILRDGLVPKPPQRVFETISPDRVFLAETLVAALSWADSAARRLGGQRAVVAVEAPDHLEPDHTMTGRLRGYSCAEPIPAAAVRWAAEFTDEDAVEVVMNQDDRDLQRSIRQYNQRWPSRPLAVASRQSATALAAVLWRRGARRQAARLLSAACDVLAVIPVPPRDLVTWLRLLQRRNAEWLRDVQAAQATLKQVAAAPDDAADEYGYYLYQDHDAVEHIEELLAALHQAGAEFEKIRHRTADDLGNGQDWHRTGAAVQALQRYAQETLEAARGPARGIGTRAEKMARDRIAERDPERVASTLKDAADDPVPHRLDEVFRQQAPLLDRFLATQQDVLQKLTALQSERAYEGDRFFNTGPETRRASGQHTLYHATAFKAEIVRDGWQAEVPSGRMGLGQMGARATWTSFSYDLHVVKEAARLFKELIEISNGRLTARTIFSWAQHEGIDQKMLRDAAHASTDLDETAGPLYAMSLYSHYLVHNTIGRPNPVFFNQDRLIATFRGKSERDVGVLACEVDLDNPDVKYIPTEREFRVPTKAILSTKVLW